MKTASLRLIVLLATLCIAGITITQFYWFRRAFNLKEQEFDRNVNTALLNVAQQLFRINGTPSPANNPVVQLSTNYFAVMVNSEIDAVLLEFLLRTEFEKRNIEVDFEYGIYDCTNDRIVYGNYVPAKPAADAPVTGKFPQWSSQGYYFGVQFPQREANILNQMGIWLFSTFVLLVVIVFFACALFVILKQKRLSEVQRDFINNITHEFKTPISTIAMSTEVLRDPATSRDRLLNYVTIIQKENSRLKLQVERVLQLASMDKGAITLKKETLNMHEVIDDAVNHANPSLHAKHGAIHTGYGAKYSAVLADKLHLTNVVYNLLDNAIKYCSTKPVIHLVTEDHDHGILVEVRDNGIGIGKENLNRIFQKFFRVPTGNIHDVKGFGIGLNYVQSVIGAHKGRITVESKLNQGSTFRFYLPSS